MARFFKKVPNIKMPKFKMEGIEDIEELNVDYTPEMIAELKKNQPFSSDISNKPIENQTG